MTINVNYQAHTDALLQEATKRVLPPLLAKSVGRFLEDLGTAQWPLRRVAPCIPHLVIMLDHTTAAPAVPVLLAWGPRLSSLVVQSSTVEVRDATTEHLRTICAALDAAPAKAPDGPERGVGADFFRLQLLRCSADDAAVVAFLASVHRALGTVTSLDLLSAGRGLTPAFFSALADSAPAVARSIAAVSVDACTFATIDATATHAGLSRLPALRWLRFCTWYTNDVHPCMGGAVLSLPQPLEALDVDFSAQSWGRLSQQPPDPVPCAGRLERLHLRLPPPAALSAIGLPATLTDLHLELDYAYPSLAAALAGCAPVLRRLSLKAGLSTMEFALVHTTPPPLPRLETLRVDHFRGGAPALPRLLAAAPALTDLQLTMTRLEPSTAAALFTPAVAPRLRTLGLGSAPLQGVPPPTGPLRRLDRLDLSHSHADPALLAALFPAEPAPPSGLSGLSSLDLSGCAGALSAAVVRGIGRCRLLSYVRAELACDDETAALLEASLPPTCALLL